MILKSYRFNGQPCKPWYTEEDVARLKERMEETEQMIVRMVDTIAEHSGKPNSRVEPERWDFLMEGVLMIHRFQIKEGLRMGVLDIIDPIP